MYFCCKVSDAENGKPEHCESHGLSSDTVTPQARIKEPKHQMLTVHFRVSGIILHILLEFLNI